MSILIYLLKISPSKFQIHKKYENPPIVRDNTKLISILKTETTILVKIFKFLNLLINSFFKYTIKSKLYPSPSNNKFEMVSSYEIFRVK